MMPGTCCGNDALAARSNVNWQNSSVRPQITWIPWIQEYRSASICKICGQILLENDSSPAQARIIKPNQPQKLGDKKRNQSFSQLAVTMLPFMVLFAVMNVQSLAQCADVAASTNTINFYLVSSEPISGGRYAFPALPRFGYISNSPSFVLNRLSVFPTNEIDYHFGRSTDGSSGPPLIPVVMFPYDDRRLSEFEHDNNGRYAVIMLNATPLIGFRIESAHSSARFWLPVNETNLNDVIEKLQSMAADDRPTNPAPSPSSPAP